MYINSLEKISKIMASTKILIVTCYLLLAVMSFPDFGLQFLAVIILHSLISYLKGCRFPGKVYTILISLTSY